MWKDLVRCIASQWTRLQPVPRVRRGPLPVMFIITSMPVGGAEMLLASLLRGLDPKRIRPEIICLKEPGPLGKELSFQFTVHSGVLKSKWDFLVLPRLVSLLRKRNAAAVVTVGAGDKMFWGRLAAWVAGVPTILSALHSTGWPDGVGRLNRMLTCITDGFIAVADSHAKHLREVDRFPATRVFAIRNGIDANRFCKNEEDRNSTRNALGIDENSVVYGIVAALRPEKNHAMFLRAARAVAEFHPEARFLIIGDGPERKSIEDLIERLEFNSQVMLLGSRSDTPELLNAMDVFVLSSQNEASPVSILEALACEVPVIATNVGSVAETVIEGTTGFLVNVDDDRTMIERMLMMLDEPETRRLLGKQGRELVKANASLGSMVFGYTELIEGCYDQLAIKRNPPELLKDRRRAPRDQDSKDFDTNSPSTQTLVEKQHAGQA